MSVAALAAARFDDFRNAPKTTRAINAHSAP
jgi:hypothetical protein